MLLTSRISIVVSLLVINLSSLYHSVFASNDYPKINTTELKVINKSNKEWSKLCSYEKCLPKCCPVGQILLKNLTCSINDTAYKFIEGVEKLTDYTSVHNKTDFEITPNLTLLIGLTMCIVNKTDFYYLNPNEKEEQFKILKTGNLFEFDSKTETPPSDYCLEYVQKFNRTVSVNCFFIDEGTDDDPAFTYYPFGMILSEVFVIATFIVYAFLPELRNLHGLCLMCHVFSLAVGYCLLSLIYMRFVWVESGDLCVITAYIVIFAFLSSFFWLNVMCFDIWWVFSGYRPPAAGSKKELEKKKFLFYSIYSWGLATVLFIIILIMEMPWIPKHLIRPEFGYDKCWFKTSEAEFYYFYLPLAFILSSNLLFFILTTCRILKISKETKVLTHGGNKRHEEHERKRFVLYLKLFLVMGINWIAELTSFFYPNLKNLWYITDASNTLQGVFIFLIFVWKRRILKLLKLKFRQIFLSTDELSKRPSKSTSLMTHQTSITSTSDSIRMKSVSSIPTVNISRTPM